MKSFSFQSYIVSSDATFTIHSKEYTHKNLVIIQDFMCELGMKPRMQAIGNQTFFTIPSLSEQPKLLRTDVKPVHSTHFWKTYLDQLRSLPITDYRHPMKA